MNGYELADILAENQPNLRVLLTTGYSEYLSAGGFRRPDRPMFLKPYSPQELVARIHEMLASDEPVASAPSQAQTKPGSGAA